MQLRIIELHRYNNISGTHAVNNVTAFVATGITNNENYIRINYLYSLFVTTNAGSEISECPFIFRSTLQVPTVYTDIYEYPFCKPLFMKYAGNGIEGVSPGRLAQSYDAFVGYANNKEPYIWTDKHDSLFLV